MACSAGIGELGRVLADPFDCRLVRCEVATFGPLDLLTIILDVTHLLYHPRSKRVLDLQELDAELKRVLVGAAPDHPRFGRELRAHARNSYLHNGARFEIALGLKREAAEAHVLRMMRDRSDRHPIAPCDFDRNARWMPDE